MGITRVSGQVVSGTASSASSLVIAFTNNPATANLVVAGCTLDLTGLTATAADANSNNYVATPASPSTFVGSAGKSYVFYLQNAPANANKSVTFTVAGGNGTICAWMREYAGAVTSTVVETDAQDNTHTGTSIIFPTITTVNDGDLLFAVAAGVGTISTADTPWSGVDIVRNGNYCEDFIQSTHGAQAIAFTQSPSGGWSSVEAAFKAAAAGGLPPGQQSFETPQPDRNTRLFPPQLRGFEQSSPRFLLAGKDAFPPGKQWFRPTNAWLAPERWAQWRTWTDSYKLTLIGKDKFNPGAQLYDLPPAWLAPERFAQWRSWTDSYKLPLIGKDRFPPGTQTNYLPSGVTWRPESPPPNPIVTLLSIVMPLGKQLYDLPPAWFYSDSFARWRTWTDSYKLTLIGKDSFPPGTQTNYLPVGVVWRPESPQQNLNNTLYSVVPPKPPGAQLYDLSPFGPQRGIDFAAPNLLNTLLFPQTIPPGGQLYELSPRAGDPFALWRSWTGSFNLNLIGQDAFPVGGQWDDLSPRAPQRWIDFAAPNLLPTLLQIPQALPPGRQMYDRPFGEWGDPFAQWRSWTQGFNLNLTGQDKLPTGVQVWELSPRVGDTFAGWRTWTGSYNLNLVGKDQLPAGVQVYELPPRTADPFAQWRVGGWFNINLTPPPSAPTIVPYLQPTPFGSMHNFGRAGSS